MMLMLLQFGLPLLLLLWLGVAPAKGWMAFTAQALSVGAVLLALALAAMWIVPPWPTPWVYGIAFLAALGPGLSRIRRTKASVWGENWTVTLALAPLILLGAFGVYVSANGLLGRVPPKGPVAEIAAPFPEGHYLIASGGANDWVNAHTHTLDQSVARFRPWRGQSYGVDIIKVDAFGQRSLGWRPADPEAYLTFGAPLVSPCAGTIVAASDGLPDLPIPEQDTVNKAGNFVMIDCGDFVVALAHLQSGSIALEVGDTIALGAPIGRMGNSGQSGEPHLHIHAQRGLGADNNPFGGEPLPLMIGGRYLVRNDRLHIRTQGDE
jgi:hypothetical protein